MPTLIDLFRQFHAKATNGDYPPSARTAYYTILGEWNEAARPDNFKIRRDVLLSKSGLTKSTLSDAVSFLTERKLIAVQRHRKWTDIELNLDNNRTPPSITVPSNKFLNREQSVRTRGSGKEAALAANESNPLLKDNAVKNDKVADLLQAFLKKNNL